MIMTERKIIKYSGAGRRLFPAAAACLSVVLLVCISCTDEKSGLPPAPAQECNATLHLSVGAFQSGTGSRAPLPGNELENRMYDIWMFQYDASTGAELQRPVYIGNSFDPEDIKATLTVNAAGQKSRVCIVANAATGVPSDLPEGTAGTWALNADGTTRSGFETFDGLKMQRLSSGASEWLLEKEMKMYNRGIPMFGVSEPIAIGEKSYVNVVMKRLFAKINVNIDLTALPSDVNISQIGLIQPNPPHNRLENVAEDWPYLTPTVDAKTSFSKENPIFIEAPYDLQFSVYVCESLFGKVEDLDDKFWCCDYPYVYDYLEDYTIRPLSVYTELSFPCFYGHTAYECLYFHPGENTINDFNVKRNHIYTLNIKITQTPYHSDYL